MSEKQPMSKETLKGLQKGCRTVTQDNFKNDKV